jgi:spore maturation protein CgeB
LTDQRNACAICSSQELIPVCEKDGCRYVRCGGCGVVRQFPYPSEADLSRYYENYQSKKSAKSPYLTDAGFEPFKRDKLFTFNDLGITAGDFEGKRVCDVGCATGHFLELLAEISRPASLFGIDASEECVQIARQRKLDCVRGDFLAVSEKFDIITMWHLIEHLPAPHDFIGHASSLLAPGGLLLIETPATGEISEQFGEKWRFLLPFEHINLFSPDALVQLCRDHGFDLKSLVRFGSGNDSGAVPAPNKRAMDAIAKKLGFGDTMAACFVKR